MSKAPKKKLKGGIDVKDLTCVTPEFRLVFPSLFEPSLPPWAKADATPKYGCTMVFDKDVDLKAPGKEGGPSLSKIIDNAKVALWGKDKDEWPRDKKGKSLIHSPLKDGDEKADEWGDAFEGVLYARADSMYAPKVVSLFKTINEQTGKPELVKITDPAVIFSGCYCRAVIKAEAYELADKSGVKLYLQMIQKIRDGEPLGASASAEDAFGVDDATEVGDVDLMSGDDDEEDEAPRKKKKKSKKPADDDEEDEAPRKKKKKSKKPADDDDD